LCWGRISPRSSVSPASLHSICFSTIIFTITRGWHNRLGVAVVPIASQTKLKKKNLEADRQLFPPTHTPCTKMIDAVWRLIIFVSMLYRIANTVALGSTQPLTEMSTRNLTKIKKPGGKVRPARRADNLSAIY
jgi:hypothetical protein